MAYKDEPRTEIIGGKIIVMENQRLNRVLVKGNLYAIFGNYLYGKHPVPLGGGAATFLEEGELYRPDIMVVCDPDKLRKNGVVCGAPDLAVEILSPSTARNDRGRKKAAYERNGVREYWIVDPANRLIEQYVLENGAFVLRDVYAHYTPEDLEDLTEAERAAVVTEFRCTLFDDLEIRLADVFYRVAD